MRSLAAVLSGAALAAASILPQLPLQPSSEPLPLIIWHGLGDNYENEGLQDIVTLAEKVHPGTYVRLIHLADSGSDDRYATFFGNVTEQINDVCESLAADLEIAGAPAVHAMGFSQGGQFLRGLVERCLMLPPVASLVTFGSQHNGISEYQDCSGGDWVCLAARALLRGSTWSGYVQGHLVPAQYFRDPEDLDSYLESSNFLADVNNDREAKNWMYKENIKSVGRFVMYTFSEDTTAVPKVSGWFSEYNATSGEETKLQDRLMYKEDWLGLRWLDERGRLVFRETPGRHMNVTYELLQGVMEEFFGPEKSDAALALEL